MKYHILLLIFITCSLPLLSQKKKVLVAKDIQNTYQKTLRLSTIYNARYYKDFTGDSSLIKNNQYTFNIPMYSDIPRPFIFLFKTEKNRVFEVSEIFYASEKSNNIVFNSQDNKIILNSDSDGELINYNTFMSLYSSEKKKLDSTKFNIYKKKNFKVDKTTIDSLQIFYAHLDHKEDSLLLNLSKKRSRSYVIFWRLVGKFEANGFKQQYYQIFNNLDPSIKKSSVGIIFNEQLKKAEKMVVGNLFPDMVFRNGKIQSPLGKKYTIVDFWFSYCQPCIEEMPKYRELYSKYQDKGFEIINISVDRTKDIQNWRKIINEKELNWVHYLDENGVKAAYYNVNKFPTNFLLDSSGKILKIDIPLGDLQVFLNENLK